MRHHIYGPDINMCKIALLVKEAAFHTSQIEKAYIGPLDAQPEQFIAYSLWYNKSNKCPAQEAKLYLEPILHNIKSLKIDTILVADANYFKYLTGEKRAAAKRAGYATPCNINGYEDITVFYIPNYQAADYHPRVISEMEMALKCINSYFNGCYAQPGQSVINSARYGMTIGEINDILDWLHTKPELTVDIETRGLQFWNCGISTIAFAWNDANFAAFPVDRGAFAGTDHVFTKPFNYYVKRALKEFFVKYDGKLILHNANFDLKILVYELFMNDLQDYRGMIDGIQTLTKNFDDTKIITYLATNNAVENNLGLKDVAKEFLGDYAEENVADTDKILLKDLLLYNGRDCLGTWYALNKHYNTMVTDNQRELYETLFKPAIITILAQELVGMPIFPKEVAKTRKRLEKRRNVYAGLLKDASIIKEFTLTMQQEACQAKTEQAKKKVYELDDPVISRITFNPASKPQVGKLLHEYLGLPILEYTDTNQPAVGQKVLAKLLNHTTDTQYRKIIRALIGLAQVDKILTSFIPSFEQAVLQPDGSYRLYGNFNLGGTLSGRLSSSDPNLQNLPSHSAYAKLIKRCFGCIEGWLFGGADFNSLEDMVSALTTRDPNKLAVYIDGYDGHCLRAYFYFGDEMPDIVHNPTSINSIKKKYPKLRQKSKPPTFLLTYQGTFHGLMKDLGLDEAEALRIEAAYHEMYKVSDEWVAKRIKQACQNGFVTGAFGLRLRTPLLLANGPGKLGYLAQKESRTAGNMLGQSYGLLNTRAATEFRERVWASKYKYDIFLCSQIHDATYIFWRNKAGITKWINDNLIACMEWCGLKELQHGLVRIGAELDIYYPDWSKATTIKNKASLNDILDSCK